MIQVKCTNDKCHFVVTREKAPSTIKYRKCPLCKTLLINNILDPIERKQWHCFLSQDRQIVEYAILVVIDSFSDGSNEVEIPHLNLKFKEQDKLRCINNASREISRLLQMECQNTYDIDHCVLTTAYQNEDESFRRNIPIDKMIFNDKGKLLSEFAEQPQDRDNSHKIKSAEIGNDTPEVTQSRLF